MKRSAKYNKGKPIQVINQRLGYMVRGGDPDAIDSIVPRYDNVPIEVVTSTKKTVNIDKYYNKERLRPLYTDFEMRPLFIMASD